MRLSDIEAIRRLSESMEGGDVGWHDREVDVNVVVEEAMGHILDLCAAIDAMTPAERSEIVENARRRARAFIDGFIITRKEQAG